MRKKISPIFFIPCNGFIQTGCGEFEGNLEGVKIAQEQWIIKYCRKLGQTIVRTMGKVWWGPEENYKCLDTNDKMRVKPYNRVVWVKQYLVSGENIR